MNLVLGGNGGIGCELAKVTGANTTTRKCLNVEFEDSISSFLDPEKWKMHDEPLHIINCTGVSVSSMLHKADVMDINRMIRVNLTANILLLKHLRPLFKERHGSTYTMLGSVTTDTCPVGTAVYTATKSALRGLVKVAAKEFSPFARINLIELGYTELGMIDQVPDIGKVVAGIPLQRLGTIDDLRSMVEMIISCEYLTGCVLKLNGGLA